jgi:phage tail-like protein
MSARLDPFGQYNFRVEIDGITRAGFKECSGLESTQDAGDYREGTDLGLTMRKLPGLISYSNITLGRGITTDRSLWDWRRKLMSGNADRRNLSIILMDDAGADAIRWNLRNCWPTKWTGPSFDATANEVAIETLELAHEGVEVDTW